MGSRRYGTADPHWITARRRGKCAGKNGDKQCDVVINPGDRAFYYPNTGTLFAESCGHAEENAADFASARFDEGIGG